MKKPSKQLTQQWYKKLEESGFQDIENTKVPGNPLKKYHNYYFRRRYKTGLMEPIADYFYQANQYLSNGAFETPIQMLIWGFHCEGHPYRKIAKLTGLTNYAVYTEIQKVRAKASIYRFLSDVDVPKD